MRYRTKWHTSGLILLLCTFALADCGADPQITNQTSAALTRRRNTGRLAAGSGHSLVLTSSGRLLSFGKNGDGQLGRATGLPGSDEATESEPVEVGDLVAVAAGATSSYALQVGGRLFAVGANGSGQRGDGTAKPWISSQIPYDVVMPTGVAVSAVAAGLKHAIALTTDGSIYAWGAGLEGQLGDGSSAARNEPALVLRADTGTPAVLDEVVEITAGGNHSLALRRDGTLWAWGSNRTGQIDGRILAAGTTDSPKLKIPLAVPIATDCDGNPLTDLIAVAAGNDHSLALNVRGQLYAWGGNGFGQSGIGRLTSFVQCPQLVPLPPGALPTQLAAGTGFSLVLLSNGHFLAWGDNDKEKLGLVGAATTVPAPQEGSIPGVFLTELVAGSKHVLARSSSGEVFGWGDSSDKQLGAYSAGPVSPIRIPVFVGTPNSKVFQIAGYNNHALLLTYDGRVFGAGDNSSSQLGHGGTVTPAAWRTVQPDCGKGPSVLRNATEVATAAKHGLAILGDGTVLPWGDNAYGQLGIGGTPPISALPCPQAGTPVRLAGLGRAIAVAAGGEHSLVLLENGTLYSFGLNSSGQLGLGETAVSNAFSPSLVKSSATTVLARSVLAAAAGEAFSLALLANGSVASWGLDNDGQLGQGTRTSASFSGQPELVRSPSGSAFLSGIVAIAACANHALALSSDGTVYAWGSNSYGQLAQDPAKQPKSSLPVAVPFSPPQRIRTIACGAQHSLAISTAGELFTFGLDSDGQLGRTGHRHVPLPVQSATGIKLQKIIGATAGFNFTLALQADGSVLAFGSNRAGAFGDTSYPDGLIPRFVSTIP